MTTVLMIRHGYSKSNEEGSFAGFTDAELSKTGVAQAKRTAEYIAKNYNVEKVYASDLKRAFITGKALADLINKEITATEKLREIYAGKWENEKYDELPKKYEDDYKKWLTDIGNSSCTDGESVAELGDRVMTAVTEIAEANDGKTIAVATHATPIRVMQTLVEFGDLNKMKDIPWVSNASVSTFTYDNGKWKCVDVSNDKHLGDLITVLPKNC